MFYYLLLSAVSLACFGIGRAISDPAESDLRSVSKKDFKQWANRNLCPRKKYSIEDIRLVDMDHDKRYDVFIVTKESSHLCMLCATSISQNYFLCDYCADLDVRKTISQEKHMAYHDTVQSNDPGLFGYIGYLFFQQPNGSFKFCNCETLSFGTQYSPQELRVDKAMGSIVHYHMYPSGTHEKYVYKWNRARQQLDMY